MPRDERPLQEPDLSELAVGDAFMQTWLLNWKIVVANLPEVAAMAYLYEVAPEAVIMHDGRTAAQVPGKNWEIGIGIVVGFLTTFPGEELAVLLYKSKESYQILHSKQRRSSRTKEVVPDPIDELQLTDNEAKAVMGFDQQRLLDGELQEALANVVREANRLGIEWNEVVAKANQQAKGNFLFLPYRHS